MESGSYQIGTDEKADKTGKGRVVRIIKTKNFVKGNEEFLEEDKEEDLYYALSIVNSRIYPVEEKDFQKPNWEDERVKDFEEKMESQYHSYIGYDFGEIIPSEVNGYRNLLEDIFGKESGDITDEELESGFLVFLGTEKEKEEDEEDTLVRLCWCEKPEDGEIDTNNPMSETLIEKDVFVRHMLIPMEQPKRMTVHYINTDGKKTSQAVNMESEITDMQEKLYVMNN